AGAFRPDIVCRLTNRARSGLSETYADTHSLTASRTISRKQPNQFWRDLVERQNRRANTCIGTCTRHAPHHAGGFVLGNHAAAGGDDILAAAHAVGAHAG